MTDISESDNFEDEFFNNHGVGNVPTPRDIKINDLNELLNVASSDSNDSTQASINEIRFARYVVEGGTLSDAYRKAFSSLAANQTPASQHNAASRLAARPRVIAKMHELHTILAELENESMATVISELNEDRKLARDLGQPAAAVSAVKAKASILGIDGAKQVGDNITVILNDEQRSALLERIGRTLDVEPPKTNETVIEDAEYEEIHPE